MMEKTLIIETNSKDANFKKYTKNAVAGMVASKSKAKPFC